MFCSGIGFDLVDPPVVIGVFYKTCRSIGCLRLVGFERSPGASSHSGFIGAEVHIVRNRSETCVPAKDHIGGHISGAVRRAGIIGGQRRSREAPDMTCVYRSSVSLDLVDPPVVSGARNKRFLMKIHVPGCGLAGLVLSRTRRRISAEVDIVEGCRIS